MKQEGKIKVYTKVLTSLEEANLKSRRAATPAISHSR